MRQLTGAPLIAAAVIIGAAGSALLGACNNVPVSSLEKSFSVLVDQESGGGDPVKIDFLWVVDNSTSMCEEQTALSDSFQSFREVFDKKFDLDLDPRVAVVTTDMICTEEELVGADSEVVATLGKFNNRPASGYPPACQAQIRHACTTDSDCAGFDCKQLGICEQSTPCTTDDECLGGGCNILEGETSGLCEVGAWECRGVQQAKCIVNPNGTLNTSCRRGCKTDQECQNVFGDSRYVCQKTSGNQKDWGCLLPPYTVECPDEDGDGEIDPVPSVLDKTNLDKFACIATVGANQLKCNRYEQGLASALAALDAGGENKKQLNCSAEDEATGDCTRFLRDDAYLVIVFVSDEDDCSSAMTIPEGDKDTCALAKTQAEGTPLVPVWHYVNSFKSLKADPARVIVAAITGDAVAPVEGGTFPEPGIFPTNGETPHEGTLLLEKMDPCTIDSDPTEQELVDYEDCMRDWYEASKGNPFICYHTSYICRSKTGIADWGSRYLELADRFGSNGIAVNICSDEGIEPALVQIAEKIVTIVKKVCLPKPVLDEGSLVVRKTEVDTVTGDVKVDASGEPVLVTLSGDDYVLQHNGGDDCKLDGQVLPAIVFVTPPAGKEEVFVSYQGDALLGQ